MIVVSNTSPLRYLITVDQATLIQNCSATLIPRAVELELTRPSATEARIGNVRVTLEI
jgi:predicted nucleic acid-binding protein